MFVTFLKTTYVHVNDAVKRRELYLIPIKNYDELKSGTQYRQKSTICPVTENHTIPARVLWKADCMRWLWVGKQKCQKCGTFRYLFCLLKAIACYRPFLIHVRVWDSSSIRGKLLIFVYIAFLTLAHHNYSLSERYNFLLFTASFTCT